MHDVIFAIKYVLPLYMQYELEYNQEDYRSLNHEYWCGLLSTIEVKYNRKGSATEIKNIETLWAASIYDSSESIRAPRKKKYRTSLQFKQQGENIPKHHGAQCYYVLFKKEVMHEIKYILYNYEDCFGKASRPEVH